MHDGRRETLEEVMDFYSKGLKSSETVDPLMKNVEKGGLQLTEQEQKDLVAFLKTLSDRSFIDNKHVSSPEGSESKAPRSKHNPLKWVFRQIR
jgi:cytochrome c peroxidase